MTEEHDEEALIRHFAPLIEKELAEIEKQTRDTEQDRAPVALDQQSVGRLSRMEALQGQALAKASETRRARRRTALQMAQRRIREGEYGYCLDCGEPVARQRLEVDPAVTLCIACANRADKPKSR
ncbi:molecular chaperone DnaK [Devosia pacifica]|uniref:Molecular chaperone DnaK n=1 Tax=Devosia pacifica TaxID=1335967 RepID=A0A918S0N7_9HYPH|nr:TraR/DksA C4-type zinc finger protein [Devosia pacifica]GHA18118.1 molecular chaperone DnaK [Devosia pacifica]